MAEGHMIRTFNGTPCDRASSIRCHQCFPQKTPEFFSMRRMWLKHHLDMVDSFVVTSAFTQLRYAEWGIPEGKMVHIPAGHRNLCRAHPMPTAAGVQGSKRNRFAFFGQLIDSKGLLELFDAVRLLRGAGLDDFSLDVHGANLRFASAEFRSAFEGFWAEEGEASSATMQRVRLRGMYEVADLARIMEDVDWVIVPSRWGETFVMVISEAFAFRKPVICSNVGVMLERVGDGVTGLHFAAGNSNSLAGVMKRAMTEDGLWDRLSANIQPPPTAAESARQHIELCYAGV
jgi:glycosyltransferase involved in cell wall biosynthesis